MIEVVKVSRRSIRTLFECSKIFRNHFTIGSSVLAISLVLGDKVTILDLSKWHKLNRYRFLAHRQKTAQFGPKCMEL